MKRRNISEKISGSWKKLRVTEERNVKRRSAWLSG